MITSLRISAVVLATSLVAGACQSGGATTTPTSIPTATPTAIPTTTTLTPQGDFFLTRSMSIDRWEHTATLLASGKVLIAGGRGDEVPLATAELYDTNTGSFSSTGSMSSARTGHTATLLANGKVLITGGIATNDSSPYLATAELYDPNTGAFSSTGSMSSARTGHTATLLDNGKVLIAGGSATNDSSRYLASAELYDPATGSFSSTGAMSSARSGQTATLLASGKVLIAGGVGPSSVLGSAELYDPATGSFSSTGSMSSPRFWHTATLLANGKILIAGGTTYNGESGLLSSAELYDPGTGTFSSTGSMSGPRIVHAATVLANGKVLITGGSGAPFEPSLASAELYDPGTGSFNSALSMASGRAFHTTTLLASGDVLIMGGGGYQVWPELYTP